MNQARAESARRAKPTPSRIDAWESAYLAFETPEAEQRKFARRLSALGAAKWRRDAAVLELFCGRGGGMRALRCLGFERVIGLDLSERVLRTREAGQICAAADCRSLPVGDASVDIVIVQGGLHHLPVLPADLIETLDEMVRVLRPGGRAVIVEPWRTPFLLLVRLMCAIPLARRLWRKLDVLGSMIEHERRTYDAWLANGPMILAEIRRRFRTQHLRVRLGSLAFVGMRDLAGRSSSPHVSVRPS